MKHRSKIKKKCKNVHGIDFSEKAKSDSDPLEAQFGEDDLEKIHKKAKEIAVEKSGQESGAKFQEEYKKAVFQLTKN